LSKLEPFLRNRTAIGKQKGCDGIDWDNIDANSATIGVTVTETDRLNFLTSLSAITREAGMVVGYKNLVEQVDTYVDLFDFAVNEECNKYNECTGYQPFIDQEKPVLGIMYNSKCNNLIPGMSVILRNLNLTPTGQFVQCPVPLP
jgi:hypothetical protein